MLIRLRLNLLFYLTAFLVSLKGLEVIDWSWGWVLAPLWLPVAMVSAIAVVGLFFAATFLAKLKKSLGFPSTPGRQEVVINDDDGPVSSDARSARQIGNVYDHEQY